MTNSRPQVSVITMGNLQIDPMLALTLAGILTGLLTGGELKGGGLQVGAKIVPGEGVQVGIDPLIYMTASLPSELFGLTFGTTSLLNKYYDGFANQFLTYEAGHRPGYNSLGAAYPLLSQAEPLLALVDPASPAASNIQMPGRLSRGVSLADLPQNYHNIYFTVGNVPPPNIMETIAAILQAAK